MISVTVRVIPQGGANQIDGISWTGDRQPFLKIRVTAPPEDGKANDAVMQLLAKTLHIRKTDIQLFRGHQSRMKIFKISGDDEDIKLRLQRLDIE